MSVASSGHGGAHWADWDGSLEWLHASVDEQRDRHVANNFVDPREHTDKWWFRLDEMDGEVIVPTAKNPEKLCRDYPVQESGPTRGGKPPPARRTTDRGSLTRYGVGGNPGGRPRMKPRTASATSAGSSVCGV